MELITYDLGLMVWTILNFILLVAFGIVLYRFLKYLISNSKT